MRDIKRIVRAGWLAAMLASASLAKGGSASGTVRVSSDVPDGVAAAIAAELTGLGYAVETRIPDDRVTEAPAGASTVAIVRRDETGHGVGIWTIDPVSHGPSFRAVVLPAPGEAVDTLPVRAAENVRALLNAPAPAAPPGESSGPAPSQAVGDGAEAHHESLRPATDEHAFALALELGAVLPSGGPSAQATALVRARARVSARFAIGGIVGLPLTASTVGRAEGDATIRASFIGGEARAALTAPNSALDVGISAGVLGVWLAMSGVARPPYAGATDDVFTSAPFLGADVARATSDRVQLRASALVGTTAPVADVRFSGVPVATWGRPLAIFGAGVGILF